MYENFLNKLQRIIKSAQTNTSNPSLSDMGLFHGGRETDQPVDEGVQQNVHKEEEYSIIPEVQQWFDQNAFNPNAQYPIDWLGNDQYTASLVQAKRNKDKGGELNAQQIGQLQNWFETVMSNAYNAKYEAESEANQEQSAGQQGVPQFGTSEGIIHAFSNNPNSTVQKKLRSLNKLGPEVAANALFDFNKKYFLPPEDPNKFQDNRLRLLMNAPYRQELIQYEPFRLRLEDFFSKPENLQRLSEISGQEVNENNVDEVYKSLGKGTENARNFINQGFSPLLEESMPGMEDSLIHAISYLSQLSNDAYPKIGQFFSNAIQKSYESNRVQEGKRKGKEQSDVIGTGDEQTSVYDSGSGGAASEMRDDGEDTTEALYNYIKKNVTEKISKVHNLTRDISQSFRKNYNPELNPERWGITNPSDPRQVEKAWENALNFGGINLHSVGLKVPDKHAEYQTDSAGNVITDQTGNPVPKPVNINIADLLSAFIPATQRNVEELIKSDNKKSQRKTEKSIKQNREREGKQPIRFSKNNLGRIQVIPPKDGITLDSMGIDLHNAVSGNGMKPFFKELSKIKKRIQKAYPLDLMKEKGVSSSQVAEKIKQDFKERGSPLQIEVTPEMVETSWRENPIIPKFFSAISTDETPIKQKLNAIRREKRKLEKAEQPIPEDLSSELDELTRKQDIAKVANNVVTKLKIEWPKLYKFIFDDFNYEQHDPEARSMFREMFGVHTKQANPISSGAVANQVKEYQAKAEQLENYPNWWEMSVNELAHTINPTGQGNMNSLRAKLRGDIKPDDYKRFYEVFHPELEMPEFGKQWLAFMENDEASQTVQHSKEPWKNRWYNRAFVERKILLAAKNHCKYLDSLISMRQNLSKFASTKSLDEIINRAKKSAFDDLQRYENLL